MEISINKINNVKSVHMVNNNPMSKEFQEEAKKRGISGYEYSRLLKGRSCGTSEGCNSGGLPCNEYQKSPSQIKQMLIEKYRGKNLEDTIVGKVIKTEKGECYHIESQEMVDSVNIGSERSLVFDIETMGFSSVPIILIGLAHVHDNNILIDQYLPRSVEEEPAMLSAFMNHVKESDTIITFNGARFDLPFVEERLSHHRIEGTLYSKTNHDALPLSRYAWKKKLPNCKLGTLEKYILGIERDDDVPSRSVPDFYRTYIKQNNVGPLVPIVEHNRQDLITLARIFSKLRESKRESK
jgi:uncharacterized protein YprB with RNaseH-like and TPR domain